MCQVKYFINVREPGAVVFADMMREANIDFSSMPTSGPTTLWVGDNANYGPTAVRYDVNWLIEKAKQSNQAVTV